MTDDITETPKKGAKAFRGKPSKHRTGHVRLYRSLLDQPAVILRDAQLTQLWAYFLLRAAYKPRRFMITTGRGETTVKIGRGQLLCSAKKLAEFLRGKPSTIRHKMLRLKSLGCITLESVTHYTIVTVCNWDTYQHVGGTVGEPYCEPNEEPSCEPIGDPNRNEVGAIQECNSKESNKNTSPSEKCAKRGRASVNRDWGVEALTLPPELDTEAVRAALADWLVHKGPKAYASKLGPKPLNTTIAKYVGHGPQRLVSDIELALTSDWAGFYFPERLTSNDPKTSRPAAHSAARPRSGKYSDPSRYRNPQVGVG